MNLGNTLLQNHGLLSTNLITKRYLITSRDMDFPSLKIKMTLMNYETLFVGTFGNDRNVISGYK